MYDTFEKEKTAQFVRKQQNMENWHKELPNDNTIVTFSFCLSGNSATVFIPVYHICKNTTKDQTFTLS